MGDFNERMNYIYTMYDDWIYRAEHRGISYGEMFYIQDLCDNDLDDLERALEIELYS